VGPEEIAAGDSTCIICRDDMTSAKKLPCGHYFHYHCLRTWLEQRDTCPYCRQPIMAPRAPQAHQQQDAAAPAQAAAAGAVNAPMPDFQMPPAAAARGPDGARVAVLGNAHLAAVGAGAAAAVPPAMHGNSQLFSGTGLMAPAANYVGVAGMPALSEETLKVHIEWQIESLQNLLGQIERRQQAKQTAEGTANNATE